MTIDIKKAIIAIFGLLLFYISPTMASCTINVPTSTTPMPLLVGNITAGEDAPVGTILAHQTYNLDYGSTAQRVEVQCTSPGVIMANYRFTQTPEPLSSWGDGGLAGKVYETGIPGIGAYFEQATGYKMWIPDSKPAGIEATGPVLCDPNLTSCSVAGYQKRWDLILVKTGPISPGMLLGSNLPCMALNYTNGANDSANLVENVCITGTINIIAGTCQTPDVNVQMGSHDITEFNGKGSALNWIDASIKLQGCPNFYGSGAYPSWYADNSQPDNGGKRTNNSLRLRLTPNTSVIDDANGIFSLTQESGSANGFGIQMGYGKVGSNIEPVTFSGTRDYVLDLNSTGLTEIPLSARYIQTDDNIAPGKANSAVTFLIDYY